MSVNKIYAWGSTAAVVLAIITGLVLSGTPGEQRMARFDEARVDDIRSLTFDIESYRNDYKVLPENLEQLINGRDGRNMRGTLPRDPETDMLYMYVVVAENTYRLCADFNRAVKQELHSEFWNHDAGYYCYEIILPELPAAQD